jgi:putative ABC transport system permease protein
MEPHTPQMGHATLFGIFAAVAIILACLGLLGLAASIAERRTREIGIRKALGADTGNIIQLLLRQFAMPVLWANLIAWPVSAYAMHRWLQGFAYHVELAVWLFPAAAGLTLLIALLTVGTHSILIARAKPVEALRYE